jgi:hypothetical protein
VVRQREGVMSTILREIEVQGAPSEVGAAWPYFVHWILTGNRRLSCSEFACVSAVDSGTVAFEPLDGDRTRVVFRLDLPDGDPGPSQDDLGHHMYHDLLVFRDYVERGGIEVGKPNHNEVTAAHTSKGRKIDDASYEIAESSDKTRRVPHEFP